MNRGRIVLFDTEVSGHHIQHINYLSQYLLENHIEILFITTELGDHSQRVPTHHPNFQVHEIDINIATTNSNPIDRLVSRYRALLYCFKEAKNWEADIVHIMSLDHSEVALLLSTTVSNNIGHFSIFASLISPYYNKSTYPFSIKRIIHYLNYRTIAMLIRIERISGLFVFSEDVREMFLDNFPDIPSDSIIVVPDPIERFDSDLSRRRAREELSLDLDRNIILFFGGLLYKKGPDLLLDSISQLPDEVQVVFAGPPAHIDKNDIIDLRDDLEDPNKIHTDIRFISDEEVKFYFISADIVVLPYRDSYTGTSGVLQHSAASGTPVIVTDVGDIGELVSKWSLGKVIKQENPEEIASAIKNMIDSGVPDIESQAEAYISRHHWRKWAGEIHESYQKVW